MHTLIWLIGVVANLFFWVILIQFLMGILMQTQVLNSNQPFVWQVYDSLRRIVDPILAPVRRIMPDTGMIDLSPIVVLIGLQLIQRLLIELIYGV